MEAAIKYRPTVHELPSQNVRACIVQSHSLRLKKELITEKNQRKLKKFKGIWCWGSTLSHEETSRLSLWLENRRFEIPSVGGLESSRPGIGGGWTDVIAWLAVRKMKWTNGDRRELRVLGETMNVFLVGERYKEREEDLKFRNVFIRIGQVPLF